MGNKSCLVENRRERLWSVLSPSLTRVSETHHPPPPPNHRLTELLSSCDFYGHPSIAGDTLTRVGELVSLAAVKGLKPKLGRNAHPHATRITGSMQS